MEFSADNVRKNAQEAETNDLLDRCTFFRADMEPEALDIIEAELRRRGFNDEAIHQHPLNQQPILHIDGLPVRCSFCSRAAVSEGWGWHRLWGLWPIFPNWQYRCPDHQPETAEDVEPSEHDPDLS